MIQDSISVALFIRIVISVTVILCSAYLISKVNIDFSSMRKTIARDLLYKINRFIRLEDKRIEESLFKSPNSMQNRYNMFLNDLRIDIEFLNKISLSFFKILLFIVSFIVTLIIVYISNNLILAIMFPLFYLTIVCILYSMSLYHKQKRISDVIETENLLSIEMNADFNNIVKKNISQIPISVQEFYRQYLTDTNSFNFTEEDALRKLKLSLGKVSYDFLSKVKVLVTDNPEGHIKTFRDIVALNNIRKLARDELNKTMRRIFNRFLGALFMAYALLFVEVIVIKAVRWFIFSTVPGQILFIVDIIILLYVYLRINMMKAEVL